MDDMQPNRPGDADRGEATAAALDAADTRQPAAIDYDAELRLHNGDEALRRGLADLVAEFGRDSHGNGV